MDVLRLVFQVVAGVLLATTAIVAVQHLRLWNDDRTRLLPLHVGMIAISYDLLVISLMTRAFDWRSVMYVPAIFLGLVAMLIVIRHQADDEEDTS